jgi:hypothetical protein
LNKVLNYNDFASRGNHHSGRDGVENPPGKMPCMPYVLAPGPVNISPEMDIVLQLIRRG